MNRLFCLARTLVLIASVGRAALAQERTLWIQVSDPPGHPLSGVRLTVKGPASVSDATDVAGKTRIKLLAPQTPAETPAEVTVSLQLVDVADGRDLAFMQPWDGQVTILPFQNSSTYAVSVVLIPRWMRQYIESRGAATDSLVSSLPQQPAKRRNNESAKHR